MDLIERYLQAVEFWLPRKQKTDIIAELSEDLHAQVEEKEAELGRPLTELEVGKILRRRGRPVLVASRFFPQEHLIGPVLFPVYLYVVKAVLLGYVVPWALIWIGMMVFNPTYRAHLFTHSWGETIGAGWSALWSTAFIAVATVTLVFAILERVQAKNHFLEEWNPRKLPPVRNPNLIGRPTASFELIINMACVVTWATNMYAPVTMIKEIRFFVSPMWLWFFWLFLLVSIVNTALAAVSLAHPYWTVQRAVARLLSDLAGSALFCWLLKANVFTGFATDNMPLHETVAITNMVNYWIAKSFPIAVAICVVVLGGNIYRIMRLKKARVYPALQAMAH